MTVTDENGVVVPYAWVFLQSSPTAAPLRCETDFAGHCEFRNLVPGLWQLRVEKPGFYVISGETVQIGQVSSRKLFVHWNEPARQAVRALVGTPGYEHSRRTRYRIEALFAELKQRMRLQRVRLRRLWNVSEQFLLAATAQNLKRLVRFLIKRPPQPQVQGI